MQLKAEIALTKDDKSLLESHTTLIQQNADAILLKVSSTDYNGVTIASLINQTADTIKIQAEHIQLEGIITANGNVKIETDGSITVNNGTFKGSINTALDVTVGQSLFMPVYTPADITELVSIMRGTKGIQFGSGSYPDSGFLTAVNMKTLAGLEYDTINVKLFGGNLLQLKSSESGGVEISGGSVTLSGTTNYISLGGNRYAISIVGGYLKGTLA